VVVLCGAVAERLEAGTPDQNAWSAGEVIYN